MEYTCSYEDIEPSSSPSGHLQILQILLPAAVDLLFHSNEQRIVSNHWTRMWNGMTEWKNSKHTQLQLTCVTDAAYSVS